jgi:hypothetical protein
MKRMLWHQWVMAALFSRVSVLLTIGGGGRLHVLTFPVGSGSDRSADVGNERDFNLS